MTTYLYHETRDNDYSHLHIFTYCIIIDWQT